MATSAEQHGTPHGSARRRRWPWIAAGIPAVLVALVLVCEAIGWPFLRGPVQNGIARALAVPVALDGRFHARFIFGPHVRAEQVRIGAASGIDVPHLLDARGFNLGWRWVDVWRWRQGAPIRVHLLEADTLDARLVRLADGRASWQLGAQDKPKTDDPEAGRPRLGTLRVGAGHIVVDDNPSKTQLVIDVRGSEGDAMGAGQGGYEATAKGNWKNLPLQLAARAGGALPLMQDDADGVAAPSVPVRVEGVAGAAKVFFDGTASALMSAQRLEGALRFSGPSLAAVGEPLGVTLPQTPPFALTGRLAHDAGVWRLLAEQATIGRSRLGGDFRFDGRATPRTLNGKLTGSHLLLADLGPAVGADGKPSAAAAAGAKPQRVLPQREFDLPSLRAMNADVQVAIDEFDFGSTALAPMQGLQTRVLLQDGVLELQALKATVAGGQLSGSTRLDGRSTPARYAADLRFGGVDIAGWIRGVQAPAATASAAAAGPPRPPSQNATALRKERDAARQDGRQPVRNYITGVLDGHIDVTGAGRSTGQILGSLDGRAQVLLRDGTVSHLVTEALGLDVAQAIGVLVRGDDTLPLRCARLDMTIKDGVAVPQTAVLDNADSTVRIDGRINLRDETLALRAVTRPRDLSPLALRTPLLVTGTLSNPEVGIDAKGLAPRLAAAAALGVIFAPAAALLALVDTGTGEKGDPCAAPPAAGKTAAAATRAGSPASPASASRR